VISPRGLTVEGANLPWQAIQDVHIGNGVIGFLTDKKGNGKYVSFGQMPNYMTFLKLLEQAPLGPPKVKK
jgi:hypothetical protein